MSISKIEWTDRTWNPVRGCSRISEGCRNCYAEAFAARFSEPTENRPESAAFYGFAEMTNVGPRWTGRVELVEKKLREPLSWRKPSRVFVNSMSDLFHESLSDEAIAAVFSIMGQAPAHTFQILTKRADRLPEWFGWAGQGGEGRGVGGSRIAGSTPAHVRATRWPLENVWLGVSVETQEAADQRIPFLLDTPAEKRFVSYEPALELVRFRESWLRGSRNIHVSLSVDGALANGSFEGLEDDEGRALTSAAARAELQKLHDAGVKLVPAVRCEGFSDQTGCPGHRNPVLDWVIVGGESGVKARPFDLDWARSTVADCKAAGVAVFVKQLGGKPYDSSSLGSERYMVPLENRKGGDPAEWAEELRVREFPA